MVNRLGWYNNRTEVINHVAVTSPLNYEESEELVNYLYMLGYPLSYIAKLATDGEITHNYYRGMVNNG